jgi:hypothetical protein
MIKAAIACIVATVAIAGCGGGSDEALPEGLYESDMTAAYLTQSGIAAQDAQRNGGTHRLTLTNGSFTDKWTNALGEDEFCTGTYKTDGGRVTFTWISGCFGDWSANYAVDGDQISWSEVKSLPPNDSADDQREAEIYNAVPWTRTDDSE